MSSDALNLEKQLRFYGAYHHNPINIGIHIIGVPIILWTTFILFTNSGTLIPLPSYLTIPYLELNAGVLFCLCFTSLYVLLEPVAGTAFSALLLAGTAYGDYLVSTHGMTANYWAFGGFVGGWVAQLLGHKIFEGRAPALLDNLFQAFALAPLFVWLECLFMVGYRPELKSRVDKLIEIDVRKYREEKAMKANGGMNGMTNGHANGHAKAS